MTRNFSLLFGALLLVQFAAAQTPGQIFRTAVNDSLLDPNGDGWISTTTSGFSDVPTIQDESEEFETSWNVLWHYELEPSSDLQTGSTCGPTEIVDNPNSNEHAAYWKIHDPDGVAGNEDELLLFRMRINSDPNNAAYGYSFLIDSDQKFGSSGPDADPNALSGNPGFEYEILFASGNSGGVNVNDVDGVAAHNAVINLQSYADGVNDQRSYARFSNCSGAAPIFIDFFIAFADLGPSVTSNTVLRMLFASASSANSALNGSASDIGGVNDSNYPDDDSIFDTYITAVPTIQFSVGYSIVDVDGDGVDDASDNCTDLTACNYDGSVNNVACTFATTWYADTDADGAGDPATTQSACTQPAGYVAVAGDGCPSDPNKTAAGVCGCGVVDVDVDSDGVCDSSDNCTNLSACNYDGSVNNVACTFATTWYADTDSDGFGDASSSQSACTQPAGHVSNSTDCDDTDNSINALDACGVCGGSGPSTWYADADGDGLGDSSDSQSACAQPAGYVADSSDNCDDTAATNFNDGGNPPCTYAGVAYTGLDSLLGCENQANVTMDLDTMHAGTGSWTYSIDTNIDGFASSSVNSNLIEIDFSANGLGRDTVEVSGTDGTNTVSISLIVQESTYPYWTSIDSDGASVGNADGGAVYTFEGHGNQAVTVHYFKDAIMIFDGGINKFAGYGQEYTLETDANGNWTSQLTDAVWVSGYTSADGCYSPEPATSGTPTSSPKIRQVTVPHLVD